MSCALPYLKVVWSDRQPLANAGAVLSLLDRPSGCDPAVCEVWFRFRMLRGYLAHRPGEVPWVYRLLDSAAEGCPGNGPAHLLVECAAVGFPPAWMGAAWIARAEQLSWPCSAFSGCNSRAWRKQVSADFCVKNGFRGGPWLDIDGTLQLLNSGHVRERDEALLRAHVLACGVWNGFLPRKLKGQHVPCGFCGGGDGEGCFFWDCTLPPLLEIHEHPEFHGLMELDKSRWLGCLLWHGWLYLLSGVNGLSPWAENPAEGAGDLLECALGSDTSGFLSEWQLPVEFDAVGAASRVPGEPDVWTGR